MKSAGSERLISTAEVISTGTATQQQTVFGSASPLPDRPPKMTTHKESGERVVGVSNIYLGPRRKKPTHPRPSPRPPSCPRSSLRPSRRPWWWCRLAARCAAALPPVAGFRCCSWRRFMRDRGNRGESRSRARDGSGCPDCIAIAWLSVFQRPSAARRRLTSLQRSSSGGVAWRYRAEHCRQYRCLPVAT